MMSFCYRCASTVEPGKYICDFCEKIESRNTSNPAYQQSNHAMHWLVSRLSVIRRDGEKGIGDTAARVFAKFGGDKFKWVFKQLNINCGCEDRQNALNKWFPYDV